MLAGKGLRKTPGYSAPPDADLVYSPAFPPGFCVAVAGLGKLGVPPVLGVFWVQWTACALLPVAVLLALGMPWNLVITLDPNCARGPRHLDRDIAGSLRNAIHLDRSGIDLRGTRHLARGLSFAQRYTNSALRIQGGRWQEPYITLFGPTMVIDAEAANWLILRTAPRRPR